MDVGDLSDEEYERAAFCVMRLAELPPSDVDMSGWQGSDVNWLAASSCAIKVLRAGVDPLDLAAVDEAIKASRLDRRDREWAGMFFSTPIGVYRKSRRWSDGRHRVAAMRAKRVPECVLRMLD